MRHAEVSYVGERDPEVVRLTERGLEQAAAAHRALAGVELRPGRDEQVAANGRDGSSRRARASSREQWPEFAEWRGGRLDDVPRDELEQIFVGSLDDQRGGSAVPRRRVARRGARPRAAGLRAARAQRDWQTALAVLPRRRRTASCSRMRSPAGRAYFGTFEQAPACINVLDLGADGRWIVRTVNYIPYDPLHPARETTMEHCGRAAGVAQPSTDRDDARRARRRRRRCCVPRQPLVQQDVREQHRHDGVERAEHRRQREQRPRVLESAKSAFAVTSAIPTAATASRSAAAARGATRAATSASTSSSRERADARAEERRERVAVAAAERRGSRRRARAPPPRATASTIARARSGDAARRSSTDASTAPPSAATAPQRARAPTAARRSRSRARTARRRRRRRAARRRSSSRARAPGRTPRARRRRRARRARRARTSVRRRRRGRRSPTSEERRTRPPARRS